MAVCALTTFDNPYDPFEQFDSWYMFDIDNNYNCCGLVDTFANTSEQLTDKENELEIERAIDEIIQYDVRNIYKKVIKKNKSS